MRLCCCICAMHSLFIVPRSENRSTYRGHVASVRCTVGLLYLNTNASPSATPSCICSMHFWYRMGVPKRDSNLPQKNIPQTTPSSNTRNSIRILTPLVAPARCTPGSVCRPTLPPPTTYSNVASVRCTVCSLCRLNRIILSTFCELHLCDALLVHCAIEREDLFLLSIVASVRCTLGSVYFPDL